MLKIYLIAVGDKMPDWVDQGYRQYQRRVHGRVSLQLIEIGATKRGKNADVDRIILSEENKIKTSIPPDTRIIALDRSGKNWATLELAERMRGWIDQSERLALIIGGPEGLSKSFITQCDEIWSLSALTFAHPLTRLVVAEQLYRCLTIIEGGPYHR